MRRLLFAYACGFCLPVMAQSELDLTYGIDEIHPLIIGRDEISYFEKGNGPTVVLYHPSVDFRYWQHVIEAVASDFRVVALPYGSVVPGVLPTDPGGLKYILESLSSGPVHLVAHSMGGRQALELAISEPGLLRSLVVVEPAGAPDAESLLELAVSMSTSDAECGVPDLDERLIGSCILQAQMNEPEFFDNVPHSLIQILVESALRVAPLQSAAAEAQTPVAGPPPIPFAAICPDLSTVEIPILFMRGELTPAPIQKSLDAYENCLPEHRSVTIVGSAHYPHVYNPTHFNNELLAFLQGI